MMSAFQIMAKVGATALLAATDGTWLLGYFAADHAVHIIYRIARRDYIVYSALPRTASYVKAPLYRVVVKTLSDFTGGLTFRLPLVLGGSYWLFNLAMSQASVFVCVHLYLKYAPGERADKMDAGVLWAGAGGLAAAFLVTFTYERAIAKRKRVHYMQFIHLTLLLIARAQVLRVPHRGAEVQAHALVVDVGEAVRSRLFFEGGG
jgi:hypothetical protein